MGTGGVSKALMAAGGDLRAGKVCGRGSECVHVRERVYAPVCVSMYVRPCVCGCVRLG